jgi:hypothetical protein
LRADRSQKYDELGRHIKLWSEEKEVELLMLGSSATYRMEQLGSSDLNWVIIGRSLGHSARAAREAFRRLTSTPKQVATRE